MVLALMAGTVQAQSASLEMAARPDGITLGEPVIFNITKTNLLPSDLEWSVKDTCRRVWSSSRRLPARGIVPYAPPVLA
jgi:hypothetical protein